MLYQARLAQSVERQTLNLVVVGSSPTVGDFLQPSFAGVPNGAQPPHRNRIGPAHLMSKREARRVCAQHSVWVCGSQGAMTAMT